MHRSLLGGLLSLGTASPGECFPELHMHVDGDCTKTLPGRRLPAVCLVGQLPFDDWSTVWDRVDVKRSVKIVWESAGWSETVAKHLTRGKTRCVNSNRQVAHYV